MEGNSHLDNLVITVLPSTWGYSMIISSIDRVFHVWKLASGKSYVSYKIADFHLILQLFTWSSYVFLILDWDLFVLYSSLLNAYQNNILSFRRNHSRIRRCLPIFIIAVLVYTKMDGFIFFLMSLCKPFAQLIIFLN